MALKLGQNKRFDKAITMLADEIEAYAQDNECSYGQAAEYILEQVDDHIMLEVNNMYLAQAFGPKLGHN